MYKISINKNQIPYKAKIEINGNIFYLKFKFNLYDNRVYTDLLDINENLLVEDEPIILGQSLFLRFYIDVAGNIRNNFPKALIIPNFNDNTRTDKITFDNIEDTALFVEEL